jgi:DNA-binding HxlR family transcriptional regulator
MRSYGEYCPLAKALDVVGDRWSLLIIRELLIRGPSRYTDVRNGLPGIASNLLAARLRELEKVGVIRREAAPPPIATTLFHLTQRGEELRPVVLQFARWGVPLLATAPDGDSFRGHWLALPVQVANLTDHAPDRPPITIEVRVGEEWALIETAQGEVRTRQGPAENPDAVLNGPLPLIIAVLAGRLALGEARQRGVGYEGHPEVLGRVQPLAMEDAAV